VHEKLLVYFSAHKKHDCRAVTKLEHDTRALGSEKMELELPFKCDIRVDAASKQASVVDTITSFTGFQSSHASQAFQRLGEDYVRRCPVIKINGIGRATPVASAAVLVEIIWALPHKAAKEFRRKSSEYVCRVLGADQSLAHEIQMRNAVTPQAVKDFFIPKSAVTVYRRDTITISGLQVEVPSENDPPEIKKWLQERLDKAFAEEDAERKLARDQRLREQANESERRLVVSRETHKRTLAELAIDNADLAAKRAKSVHDLFHYLEDNKLIHQSLMTAAIGSIANMAADAAGITLSQNDNTSTHLEEFSVMAHKLCQTAVDMTHLSAIARLAAKEYRKRYDGQKPDQLMKQVNGGLHPVNVYNEKDREWVEDIVKNYIANIPNPQSSDRIKGPMQSQMKFDFFKYLDAKKVVFCIQNLSCLPLPVILQKNGKIVSPAPNLFFHARDVFPF
jgi:hypothetical protein